MGELHATAQIAASARLGRGVKVGAFAVIEAEVVVGDGCVIDSHAVIRRYVKMGPGNRVHPQAVLGGLPQDLGFDPEAESWLEIGANNVFREGVTINRASQPGQATRIGSNNYFMNLSHVGHDCTVGDHTILASSVALGGFVEVGDRVFLGGGAMVHQFCRIGTLAMIRGTSGVSKDVLPYTLVGGNPVKHYRLNSVGLKRAGIVGDRYRTLSQAFRWLRLGKGLAELAATEEIDTLRQWLAAPSQRGVHGFV